MAENNTRLAPDTLAGPARDGKGASTAEVQVSQHINDQDAGSRGLTSVSGGADVQKSFTPTPQPERNTAIKGRLNQYRPAYWSLALPALSVRYLIKPAVLIAAKLTRFGPLKGVAQHVDHIHSAVTGLFMMVVSLYYAQRTYTDMRNVFAETIGWERDKPADKVNVSDILNSKNSLVQEAKNNFLKYNFKRVAINLPFFLNVFPGFKKLGGAEMAADIGVGANAVYLLEDSRNRKETFFERLQFFVDNKINHTDGLGESITAVDLINLYDRYSRDHSKNYKAPHMDSPEWQDDKTLFTRVAQLMNETYKNDVTHEHADFTVSKLIYLLGEGLVKPQELRKNLAFVELANRYGIESVKAVNGQLRGGVPLETAIQPYPLESSAFALCGDAAGAGPFMPGSSVDEPAARKRFTESLVPPATHRDMATSTRGAADMARA